MMEDVKDKSLKDREYLPRRLHKKSYVRDKFKLSLTQ
jgi:hypothetical protein